MGRFNGVIGDDVRPSGRDEPSGHDGRQCLAVSTGTCQSIIESTERVRRSRVRRRPAASDNRFGDVNGDVRPTETDG